MKIPKYWARGIKTVQDGQGREATFSCWQWSDVSVADAQQKANVRAERLAWKLLNNEKLERYGYGTRPLREEIQESIKNWRNQDLGVVTRNAYGALILNAVQTMFIDIDFPPRMRSGSAGLLKRLFSKGKPAVSPDARYIQAVEQWAEQHPSVGMRLYRTFGGLRCLITSEVFDPTQESTLEIMRALQCDPLYVTLCRSQACFRARLTPKPWRCDARRPPARYPWQSQAEERAYRRWENAYTHVAAGFTVCRLVKQLGPSRVHPDVEPILEFHDQVACTGSDLALA